LDVKEELLREAERRCHEAVREFQAGLARLAEMQPLESALATVQGAAGFSAT
jgi:hypothetical protein